MMRLFLLLCFCTASVFGQKIHLPHEVEKAAEPTGGLAFLSQFIASNVQIPFMSAIKGVNGRVYIKGVVEPDGSLSQLEISRGLDSLTNKEALRIMGLYKAWQPATLKGEKVRQSMIYPIAFKAPPTPGFDSTKFALVNYFDSQYRGVSDPKKYEYRSILPLDKEGYIKADVVYEQLRGGKWKEISRIPFQKKEIWYKTDVHRIGADSIRAYEVSARDLNGASHSTEAVLQPNGNRLSYTEYGANNKASMTKKYDHKGMVRDLLITSDSATLHMSWFDNGQVRTVTEVPAPKATEYRERLFVNAWNREGKQIVKEGEGYWKSTSEADGAKLLVEEGPVTAGKKDGKWVGKLADSTLYYEEIYEKGILKQGVVFEDGQKRTYDQAIIQPQFKGGLNRFYKFLGENIKYPMDALSRGVKGRVMLSFVVCEDGSLCDYKVENGLGFGLDDEALRVVKKMSGMWEPGAMRGKLVRVKYNLPINFQF